MLDHLNVNVTDLAVSRAFYLAALAPLGYAIVREYPGEAVGFGVPAGFGKGADPHGDFWIGLGAPQTPRPHFAFTAETPEIVRAFHTAALAAGGRDNGKPGPRNYHPGYCAAFVHDPDGYNIEAVCHDGPV